MVEGELLESTTPRGAMRDNDGPAEGREGFVERVSREKLGTCGKFACDGSGTRPFALPYRCHSPYPPSQFPSNLSPLLSSLC